MGPIYRRYAWRLVIALLLQALGLSTLPYALRTQAQPLPHVYLPLITANASSGPQQPVWAEKYFANTDLAGLPTEARNTRYAHPAKDWGGDAPSSAFAQDGFSARFDAFVPFEAGHYTFMLSADDRCRLWINSVPVIDQWTPTPRDLSTYVYDTVLPAGLHSIRVEYADHVGLARVRCFWMRSDLYPNWRAEYWSNPNLDGPPSLVRNETTIDHGWGSGSPAAGIPSDGFSVRWTGAVLLREGQHVFQTWADDGVKVWVDEWSSGRELIAAWNAAPSSFRSAARYLPAHAANDAWHVITVVYRDISGQAACRFTQQFGGAADTYLGEYYSDTSLTTLAKVQNDAEIRFPGDTMAFPPSGVVGPSGVFSVRWTRAVLLTEGTHTWKAEVDDGCRVWLDDQPAPFIDDWSEGGMRQITASVYAAAGWHVLRMEFFHAGSGEATARLWKQ
ncbi:MAG: PA14 domain-containing protein [Anaerolineae bacterium]